jgi:hypothetical protein
LSRAEPKRFRDGDQRRVATGHCHPIQLLDAAVRGHIGGEPGCPRRRPLGPGLDRSLPLCAPSRRHTDPRIRSGRKFAAMLKTVRDSPLPGPDAKGSGPFTSPRVIGPGAQLRTAVLRTAAGLVSDRGAQTGSGAGHIRRARRNGAPLTGGASPRRICTVFPLASSEAPQLNTDPTGADGMVDPVGEVRPRGTT